MTANDDNDAYSWAERPVMTADIQALVPFNVLSAVSSITILHSHGSLLTGPHLIQACLHAAVNSSIFPCIP